MDAWAQVVLAIVALGGPLLAYLGAVRKTSGRIRDTDASELWDEATNIRKEYLDRIRVLEERIKWEEERYMRLREEYYELQRHTAGGGS
jgi:molecular chaperone GrpE (heat shock protein)